MPIRFVRRLSLGAITSFFLSTTAWSQASPPQPANACQLVVVARLPLTEGAGHYLAPVGIGGNDYPMVVDTGAAQTAVMPQAAQALQLGEDILQHSRITGMGGRVADHYSGYIPSLKLGAAEWDNVNVAMFNMFVASELALPSAPIGLLGADVLSRYDVAFDFPSRTMTLYSAKGCLARFVPWAGRYFAYSAQYTRQHKFVIPLVLDGHPIHAIIDTGATRSVLTRRAAIAVGIDSAALDLDPKTSALGANRVPIAISVHRFPSLTIGPLTYRNIPMEVADTPLEGADMLLGMDFMKSRRVWMSYSSVQVFMQPASVVASARH